MPDQPNLDYDPGPDQASYSRLGPPAPAVPAAPAVAPAVAPALHLSGTTAGAYEFAAELGAGMAVAPRTRRGSRRVHRFRKA
jgi:hypothetical protein